jgi:hypothetical protein
MAGNPTAITQRAYLQSMAGVCGDSLPAPPTDTALINWARLKGMNPSGGWNLDAELTKEAMACTMVQLLNMAPGKADSDPVRILEAKGIFIGTSGGHVTMQSFRRAINNAFIVSRTAMNRGGNGNGNGGGTGNGNGNGGGNSGNGNGHDNHEGDDDDDDDGGGPPPTPTKPGYGYGDKNHVHTGPPGQKRPH